MAEIYQYLGLGPFEEGDEYLVGRVWLPSQSGAMVEIPYDVLHPSAHSTRVAEESLRALGCRRRRKFDEPIPDTDPDGWTRFGWVARELLGMQCQYASRYLEGRFSANEVTPVLSYGLRFRNMTKASYHDIEVHVDSIDEFVRRVVEHRVATGQIRGDE